MGALPGFLLDADREKVAEKEATRAALRCIREYGFERGKKTRTVVANLVVGRRSIAEALYCLCNAT
jgi:hypothetical protein